MGIHQGSQSVLVFCILVFSNPVFCWFSSLPCFFHRLLPYDSSFKVSVSQDSIPESFAISNT